MSKSDWCWNHDPDLAEQRAAARARGGRSGRRRRPSAAAGSFQANSIESAVQLLSLAANETLRLDNTVSRNRALADIASKAISGFQAGELEERILALEVEATEQAHGRGAEIRGRAPQKSKTLRVAAWRGSIATRVERLEACRIKEYEVFGGRILDVVLGVLGRHVHDRVVLIEIRNDIAKDLRALTQTEPSDSAEETVRKVVGNG